MKESRMKISLIIPTRSRPEELRSTLGAAYRTAMFSAEVEAVCRLDADDPRLDDYIKVLHEFPQAVFIIGQRRGGYSSLVEFMDECAAISTGDLIMCFNDDMVMLTSGWDEVLCRALAGRPLAVGIGELMLNGDPGNQCQYACAVIPRPLYQLCGALGLGGLNELDRCWEALARHAGCEVKTSVQIAHRQNFTSTPDTNAVRNEYGRKLHANWGERSAAWEEVGRRYAALVKKQPNTDG